MREINENLAIRKIKAIYEEEKLNGEGRVADYIPQLAKYSPDYWGVAVTTIDGQRLCLGDTNVNFALQSSVKPYMYAVAITEESPQYVSKIVCGPLHKPSSYPPFLLENSHIKDACNVNTLLSVSFRFYSQDMLLPV